jgi:putative holliday junction resolvase
MAQPNGRILAMDFGKRRIGLAISDGLGITAQPLPTYTRARIREDIATLSKLARDRDVTLFVFGNPKYMSGDESRQSEAVKEFAERLSENSGIPVHFWDERLTSSQAHRLLDESGFSREQRKGKVDQIAAALILEGYLQSLECAESEES